MAYHDESALFSIVSDYNGDGGVQDWAQASCCSEDVPGHESEGINVSKYILTAKCKSRSDSLQRRRNIPDYHAQRRKQTTRRSNGINNPFRIDRSQCRPQPRNNNINGVSSSRQLIDLSNRISLLLQPKTHIAVWIGADDHASKAALACSMYRKSTSNPRVTSNKQPDMPSLKGPFENIKTHLAGLTNLSSLCPLFRQCDITVGQIERLR
jgi:hypothetical protein